MCVDLFNRKVGSEMSKVLTMTTKSFAKVLNKACIGDKQLAEKMFFKHGVRGNVTAADVRRISATSGKDFFEASGKLTEKARTLIEKKLEALGLPKTATLDEVIEANDKAIMAPLLKSIQDIKATFKGFNKK